MKIKKINSMILIMCLIFAFCFGFVNANIGWYQNANSNYQSYGGNSFIMYGSNTLNPEENITYSKCTISTTDYQPVVADFTRDGVKEIVLTNTDDNEIYFYNSVCELVDTYSLEEDIMAMPMISFPIVYNLPVLNILTNKTYTKYGYFSSSVGFDTIGTDITYSDYVWWEDGGSLDFFICDNDYCLAFKKDDDLIYHFDINANVFTNTTNTLSDIIFDHTIGISDSLGFNGLSSIEGLGTDDNWAIVCNIGEFRVGIPFNCDLINLKNGVIEQTIDMPIHVGYTFEKIFNLDIGGAIQSNEKRIYTSYYLGISTTRRAFGINVFDLNGNLIYNDSYLSSSAVDNNDYSNIVVADFNKDGNNEMCYLTCNRTNYANFSCYDSDFNEVFFQENVTNSYTSSGTDYEFGCPNFVLGDFMSEYDNLCMATIEGIFCFNETNHTIHEYDTGYTSGNGTPLVVEINNDGYLGVVYSDNVRGFVITPDFINYSTCGNGICEAWENSFTCSEDCYYIPPDVEDAEGEYREGSPCETDDDCTGDLRCEYGVCTKLPGGYECTSDSDCLSGECLNGKCTKPSFWDSIGASKDQQFGDDTNTNNFLALFFMVCIAGFLGYYGNVWMGVGSFYILGIFFSIVGWLSVFIIFGLILTGLIALVFKFTIGNDGG